MWIEGVAIRSREGGKVNETKPLLKISDSQ